MSEVGLVTVGNLEVADLNIAEVHNGGSGLKVSLCNVIGKSNDLLTCESGPVIILITLNTGTDKVEHQLSGISEDRCGVFVRISLKDLEVLEEFLIG